MIKVLEKDFLNDSFIIKEFADNISIKDNFKFNSNNIYYFGNYKEDKLNTIKKKIINNKKSIKNAIEKGAKFIITGNSVSLFNNNFNINDINLFNLYNEKDFKRKNNKLRYKKKKKNNKIYLFNNLNSISYDNFRYKNLICISNINNINNVIKKVKN